MITRSLISDIHAAIAEMRVKGIEPDTVYMHPAIGRFRSVMGNAKQRKEARFWNRKRIKHFKDACGLDVRLVRVPRDLLP